MSTLKTTNIQHPSAASPSIVLASSGNATYAATHDFTAATVTGAGGLRLVTPTSIANSGGTATASGGAVTFTGVNSISLNGCFSTTYLNYKIVINLTANSVAGPTDLNFRYRISGTDQTASSYYMGFNEIAQAGGLTTSVANPASAFLLGRHGTGVPSQTFFVESAAPFVSGTHHMLSFQAVTQTTGAAYAYRTGVGDFIGSGSMDGFSLVMATNTFTGTLRVYGYQN